VGGKGKREAETEAKVKSAQTGRQEADFSGPTRYRLSGGAGVDAAEKECLFMFPLGALGKILVLFGLILAGIGLLLIWSDKIPWIGRLPGDILIKKKNFTFYFPLATSLLISVILTLLFSFFRK
jgi:hypothetical protein